MALPFTTTRRYWFGTSPPCGERPAEGVNVRPPVRDLLLGDCQPPARRPVRRRRARASVSVPFEKAPTRRHGLAAGAGFGGGAGSGGLVQTGSLTSLDAATAVGFRVAWPQAVSTGSFA